MSVVLFLRQSDGLTRKEAGKFFLKQAKDILNRSDVAVQTLKAHYTNTDETPVMKMRFIPNRRDRTVQSLQN